MAAEEVVSCLARWSWGVKVVVKVSLLVELHVYSRARPCDSLCFVLEEAEALRSEQVSVVVQARAGP